MVIRKLSPDIKGKKTVHYLSTTNKIILKLEQRLKYKSFIQPLGLLKGNLRDMPHDIIVGRIILLNIRPQKSQWTIAKVYQTASH